MDTGVGSFHDNLLDILEKYGTSILAALITAIITQLTLKSIQWAIILFFSVFFVLYIILYLNRKKSIKRKISKFLNMEVNNALNIRLPTSDDICQLSIRDIVTDDEIYLEPELKDSPDDPQRENLADYIIKNLLSPARDNSINNFSANLLILGDPGSGKTIILKKIFSRMADLFNNGNSDFVPIYFPFNEVDYSSVVEGVSQNLHNYLKEFHGLDLSYEEFHSLETQNKLFFLFDGLDELSTKLDLNSINTISTSPLFHYPCVLSCRKNIFESCFSNFLDKNSFHKLELEPLRFESDVKKFIKAFCEKAKFEESVSQITIERIEQNEKLLELATNHLMLFMMINVFSDPNVIGKYNWDRAKLYDSHINKWLMKEEAKQPAILSYEEKKLFLTHLAWLKYKNITSPLCYKEGYVDVRFTEQEITRYLSESYEVFKDKYVHLQELEIEDVLYDILHRSLLTPKSERYEKFYYFFQRSYQEYFIAEHIFSTLIESKDGTVDSFKSIIPSEISNFLKDKLLDRKNADGKGLPLITSNLMQAYEACLEESWEWDNILAREQACYYLARLGEKGNIGFLEKVYRKESDLYVQRGIVVGLILFCGRKDLMEEYASILNANPEAALINLGYHLIYYGDQLFEGDFHDRGGQKCDGTIQAIVRHLNEETHRLGWTIDLITLRTLLMDTNRNAKNIILSKGFDENISKFLNMDHSDQGESFHKEKEIILENFGK